ncbi:unnamed protein product [Cuscuta campestris]|uniref:F-box domain-containing protein n=1 Tax=Cuscuta campestris TaxID=132261 RepID=A0A484LXE4_9ASTE|nr:unnamed protein product [Cuscuta campestris]
MAMRDRISELPCVVLDRVLGFLPIQEAARIAILSTVWRDVWLSLSQLNFDHEFFCYIRDHYIAEAAFYVVNQILTKHIGHIRTFVFAFHSNNIQRHRDRLFELDQWLLFLTQNGIEEVVLSFGYNIILLPDCIFSCLTLKKLDLHGVLIEPINAPCIFPNVTSLHLGYARFGSRNHVGSTVNLPKLESLTCGNISGFKITVPKLRSLKITSSADHLLPVNLDLKPISSLNLMRSSALKMCPKLCKLDVKLRAADTSIDDDLLKHSIDIVARRCRNVRTLKIFCLFKGSMHEMCFFEWLVALFPTLEKVAIFQCRQYHSNTEMENKRKLLLSLRAASNAEIVYV